MSVRALVENVTPKGARIAFVLESPHVEEVKKGYPLAGDSGVEMSRRLLNEETPFGYIGKCHVDGKKINTKATRAFSVMNVSRTPMQSSAYEKNNLNIPSNIKQLERLRKLLQVGSSMAAVHSETHLNRLKQEIYNEFKLHAGRSLASHQIIVPCGNFSLVFCTEIMKESSIIDATIITGVPHPSMYRWSKLQPEIIERIRRELL